MKYSKGEWQIKSDNLGCKQIIVKNEGIFTKHELGYTHGLNDEEEDLGNARLIAGAKDTYEALKLALTILNTHVFNVHPDDEISKVEKYIIEKAIAKVERG